MRKKEVPDVLVKLWHARRALERANLDDTPAYDAIGDLIAELEDQYDLGFSEVLVFGENEE